MEVQRQKILAAPAVYVDVLIPGVGKVALEPAYAKALAEHITVALAAISTPAQPPSTEPTRGSEQSGEQADAENRADSETPQRHQSHAPRNRRNGAHESASPAVGEAPPPAA